MKTTITHSRLLATPFAFATLLCFCTRYKKRTNTFQDDGPDEPEHRHGHADRDEGAAQRGRYVPCFKFRLFDLLRFIDESFDLKTFFQSLAGEAFNAAEVEAPVANPVADAVESAAAAGADVMIPSSDMVAAVMPSSAFLQVDLSVPTSTKAC